MPNVNLLDSLSQLRCPQRPSTNPVDISKIRAFSTAAFQQPWAKDRASLCDGHRSTMSSPKASLETPPQNSRVGFGLSKLWKFFTRHRLPPTFSPTVPRIFVTRIYGDDVSSSQWVSRPVKNQHPPAYHLLVEGPRWSRRRRKAKITSGLRSLILLIHPSIDWVWPKLRYYNIFTPQPFRPQLAMCLRRNLVGEYVAPNSSQSQAGKKSSCAFLLGNPIKTRKICWVSTGLAG